MIGGDAKVLRRAKPYFAPFVENIFPLGPLGSGHSMKLIHNMVLHTIFLATCEGARMAERMGMKVSDMIDVFNVSTAFSYASRHRFPRQILNGSWNGQARIYNPWKDVGIAVRLAHECGADVGFGERTLDFLEKAVARGMTEQDYTLLYRDFEEIAKNRGGKAKRPRRKKRKRPAGDASGTARTIREMSDLSANDYKFISKPRSGEKLSEQTISSLKKEGSKKTMEVAAHQKTSGELGASAAKSMAVIKSLGFTHVLMIPDSESRLLYDAIGNDPDIQLITPCREGESIAIAAGLWTGGRKPLIVIQCTGFMEAGDALRGCGLGPRCPFASWWAGAAMAARRRAECRSTRRIPTPNPCCGHGGSPSGT